MDNCIKMLDEMNKDFSHYKLNAASDEDRIIWDLITTKLDVLRNKFFREIEAIEQEYKEKLLNYTEGVKYE